MNDQAKLQEYLGLIEKAARECPGETVLTIPQGFRKRVQDRQSIERERIEREFKNLVLERNIQP